jgi:hypothetical protein
MMPIRANIVGPARVIDGDTVVVIIGLAKCESEQTGTQQHKAGRC